MFETSFALFLKYLLLNILIPFIPWLLFLWLFYGTKIRWFLLWLLSRFIWVWVVAFSLLNIQFIHFWVWIAEYFIILWILLIAFVVKVLLKKQRFKEYIETLKIKNIILEVKSSFVKLSNVEKVFTIILSVFSIYFICISWIFSFNLPTYADDSFWNWNNPAYNIYTDWWVKLFWETGEILWRWRLWYPIHVPVYKALMSQFAGEINDIYFNTWQRLVFVFWLLFIFSITFNKTQNIFKSILPIWLILSLPLVFFHSFEWYMELPSIVYCIICVRLFYEYLEDKDFDYLSLWLLFWFIISYIKNDGFVVYFPGLLIALLIVLCLKKNLRITIKWLFQEKNNLFKSVWYFVYFFIPFLLVKIIHWLWFNQAAWETSWIWLSNNIHREIFSQFPHIFFKMDNYNLVLIILLFILVFFIIKKQRKNNKSLFLYSSLAIFLILIAVFLFTDNYRFVMDQTTVNRVFTTSFILLFWFSGLLLSDK